jgi:hypothetical protein
MALSLTILSLYLYLPLRTALVVQPKWGDPVTLKSFLWVVTRELASKTETLLPGWGHYLIWISEYLRSMSVCWWGWFWVLGLGGTLFLFRNDRKLFWSLGALYSAALFALVSVPRDETLFLFNVYLIPIHGVFILAVFLGSSCFVGWGEKMGRVWGWVLAMAFLLSLVVWGFRMGREEDKSRYTLAGDFGVNLLKGLPRNSLLLAEGDHAVMPLWYCQYVDGMRPDVTIEPSVFLLHDWGWKQLAGMLVDVAPLQDGGMSFPERLRGLTALSGKHPFFYSLDREYFGAELGRLPGVFEPAGLVRRWDPRVRAGEQVFHANWELGRAQRLRGLDLFRDEHRVDISTNEIYRYYANQYFETGQFLQGRGKTELALKDFERGIQFYPSTAWVYSNMAVLFGQKGYFELSSLLCERGIHVEPRYLPSYLNLINIMRVQGRVDQARLVYERALGSGLGRNTVEHQARELGLLGDWKGPIRVDRSRGDYRKLGEDLRKKDLSFLSALALGVAEERGVTQSPEKP